MLLRQPCLHVSNRRRSCSGAQEPTSPQLHAAPFVDFLSMAAIAVKTHQRPAVPGGVFVGSATAIRRKLV